MIYNYRDELIEFSLEKIWNRHQKCNSHNRKEILNMKPMLPTLAFEVPIGSNWRYEVKYDGFRAIFDLGTEMKLTSRNGKPLLHLFPELTTFFHERKKQLEPYLPLTLDGELVLLYNQYKANFKDIQIRGRMRSKERIIEKSLIQPCQLLTFDLLQLAGKSCCHLPYSERKQELENFFTALHLPLQPDEKSNDLLQMIPAYENFESIWEHVVGSDGEGIIAKNVNSKWTEGSRTTQWIKYKNWKFVSCFITTYDKTNGYFSLGVFKNDEIITIGQLLFGLKPDEKQALLQVIKENQQDESKQFINIAPAICLDVKYLEVYDGQLREPHFDRFRFDLQPSYCTFNRFSQQQLNFSNKIEITHPDKLLWKIDAIQKNDYIKYLHAISPYLLPFLEKRALTMIRYPHGVFGEPFYQKNCPDYAPSFVQTYFDDGIDYIVCNDLNTLLWLGNQLAIEFHIPFQTVGSTTPSEIVFDLDPPSKQAFPLAVKAALMIKEILDTLQMISFVKTSGNKGLQIYIPLPDGDFTFEDTRLFTSFIADYLVTKAPDDFTTERMKKKRGNRLYVDYVQHAEGKTLVAPYSVRGNELATVATPLYWEEVNEQLSAEVFRLTTIWKRIQEKGDPFQDYFAAKKQQPMKEIIDFLKQKSRS